MKVHELADVLTALVAGGGGDYDVYLYLTADGQLGHCVNHVMQTESWLLDRTDIVDSDSYVTLTAEPEVEVGT